MKKGIVLGASSGIGMEVSRLLLADGWTLGVASRRTHLLQELKDQWPSQVEVAAIDVTSDEGERQLLELTGKVGGMDLFFYAPGIGHQNPSLEAGIEMSTVETNALGFTRMIGAAYRFMAGHGGGHIAAITSIAGTKGLGPAPSYSATKAFQNTYLQALEQLANNQGLPIRFTDIRPGFVDTALIADGNHYPMTLQKEAVAREIMTAIGRRQHIRVIDWRWRIVTAFWRRIPRWVWRRLPLTSKKSTTE